MITEDYVSFETAKLLKEKKFNELVPSFYGETGLEGYMIGPHKTSNSKLEECFCARPTHQMVMKWLREVHNITIGITFSCGLILYEIQKNEEFITSIGSTRTYEQMVEEAIQLCVKTLI